MSHSFAIYTPSPQFGADKNPFGKDTANVGLFRALAQHGGFDQLTVLSVVPGDQDQVSDAFRRRLKSKTRVRTGNIYDSKLAIRSGSVLRGEADLAD